MELHAVDRQLAVSQAHDQAVVGLGGDLEATRKRGPLDDQRVITRGREAGRDVLENALAAVADLAEFAMHRDRPADDLAAEGLPDGLVAEADAEDGDLAGGSLD